MNNFIITATDFQNDIYMEQFLDNICLATENEIIKLRSDNKSHESVTDCGTVSPFFTLRQFSPAPFDWPDTHLLKNYIQKAQS